MAGTGGEMVERQAVRTAFQWVGWPPGWESEYSSCLACNQFSSEGVILFNYISLKYALCMVAWTLTTNSRIT